MRKTTSNRPGAREPVLDISKLTLADLGRWLSTVTVGSLWLLIGAVLALLAWANRETRQERVEHAVRIERLIATVDSLRLVLDGSPHPVPRQHSAPAPDSETSESATRRQP